MDKIKMLRLVIAVLGGAFIASTTLTLPPASAATVTVNMNSPRQTIEGIGADYAFSQSSSKVGQYTLQNLKPTHARVEMDLSEWEPTNDDSNPLNFNWPSFHDSGSTHNNFLQLQDLKSKGIGVVASIWNGAKFRGRHI